ncbi:MAG: phospholipase [Clostridia bacterium]|nr:phospholipase [Clostridia bacterium]
MYTKHKWESENHYNFKYLRYLPEDFDKSKKYPLVFFLHGAGERGDDPDIVALHGYLQYVKEENAEYPFIIIAPQCPEGKYWGCFTESLLAFLDWTCEDLPVDKSRIYLTGLSMGGTGTFMLAMAAPETFAAIAPVCGSGICWYAGAIKDIPTYIFHGDCDTVVPIYESITMLKNINLSGGNAIMEICHGVGHNAWDVAYKGDKLYKWMLKFSKEDNKQL